MKTRNYHRLGRVLASLLAVLALCLVLGGGAVWWLQSTVEDDGQTVLLHTIERGDFEAFVTEPGDVVSSSNVEIRCQVESRGTPGTSIVKICDEGSHVQAGDFLVQFDDSLLQNELIAQKIVSANDRAALIQAQSDQANAERTLAEFVDGLYKQECEVLESAIFVAEEELRKKELALESTRRMAAKGMLRGLQVSADEFAVDKARKDVAAAQRALDVYRDFTRDKTVGEYKAEIEKQKANVEAATFTLELSEQKLEDIEKQISFCFITAPTSGQVVYANDRNRGENPTVVEEGTLIRYNQVVIRLPDIEKMQVDVKINESHVNRIRPGQPARIELDADPENVLYGEVVQVAPFPFPMRWHGAPLEYGVDVAITDPPSTIRPGLRAKVKIFFESHLDVLQVPLAAVIAHEDSHYCLKRDNDDWLVTPVQIGSSNNNQVIIVDGLNDGDQVALTPFRFIQRSDLPTTAKPQETDEAVERAAKLSTAKLNTAKLGTANLNAPKESPPTLDLTTRDTSSALGTSSALNTSSALSTSPGTSGL